MQFGGERVVQAESSNAAHLAVANPSLKFGLPCQASEFWQSSNAGRRECVPDTNLHLRRGLRNAVYRILSWV
jgi:hypothetical protein